ncbi:uncharacterized protein MJAP1_000565 [Malassezia japonica]|uniref:Mediator of RNA polymerase II transcription subunit 22 n=1 Tax=Malassezia japonica TaxID=223818 RepID=A0AAF0J8T8_9BASI|nr:uncharacterized protein MJAP1_000565 [Malassezia japonica]WFD37618.1 hypothetical protein MJAP1_000565 [Malassezia japonica]
MAEASRHPAPEPEAHAGNTAHLDALEEAVNKRIDADVETLMDNYKEIINLSRIGGKDHFDVSRESFQLETRADSMVRAAQSLYLLSDSLKLSLLLSQSQMSDARNSEAETLLRDTDAYKRECSELLAGYWLPGAQSGAEDAAPAVATPAAAHEPMDDGEAA